MAKAPAPAKSSEPSPIADGLFAGIDPNRAAEIAQHYESKIAAERQNLDALLEEVTSSAEHASSNQVSAAVTSDGIVAALGRMEVVATEYIAVLAAKAKSSTKEFDHVNSARYSRLTTVFGEFRNAIVTFLASQG